MNPRAAIPRHEVVVRYQPNGSLDTTSTTSAVSSQDTYVTADNDGVENGNPQVVIQADGKILVGGNSLIRLNTDGSLDMSFGPGGVHSRRHGFRARHDFPVGPRPQWIDRDRRHHGRSHFELVLLRRQATLKKLNPDGSTFEGFNGGQAVIVNARRR